MNASPRDKSKSNREIAQRGGNSGRGTWRRPAPKVLWPALVAINGFGFAVNQSFALELGELSVQSTLGQPLRASIAYALAPHEMIQSHCIFLRPGASAAGLPGIGNATTSASNGVIRLTGNVPIREPILNLSLMVECPGTANLNREYTVFVDPPRGVPAPAAGSIADRAPATVRSAQTAVATERPARLAASNTARFAAPVRTGSTYRVQPGDTLSGIAARIADRDISLWQAVDVIFAANPEAFIDNDRNRLRAGSVLVLPDLGTVSADVPGRSYESSAAAPATTTGPAQTSATAVRDGVTVTTGETADAAAMSSGATASVSGRDETAPPGNAPAALDNPFVSAIEPRDGATSGTFGPAREVIPDTAIDMATARTAPRVSVAVNDGSGGLNSLAWLGGTGIAIILGLLLFGRQLKDRFGSPGDILPAGIKRGRRRTDFADEPEAATRPADDEPRDTFESPIRVRPVALDADLGSGSGFDRDGDIDVAQDFGFSTARDLYEEFDMELTEASVREPDQAPADIMLPKRFDHPRFTDTIIVEEISPSDDTGDYDLSMIVDATRQPIADVEDTTKDLRAVQVDTGDNEALTGENLTLSREVDYKILEQDYEEELTATQALNTKLLTEAGLGPRVEDPEAAGNFEAPTAEYAEVDEELTMQLPEGDLEMTAEMPLDQEPVLDAPQSLEDSGVNVEVTTELPVADNDEMLEMDIEPATIDIKKLRAL